MLISPERQPPSTAVLVERITKIQLEKLAKSGTIAGRWDWKQNGLHRNGDIILWPDGRLSHDCGWTGGNWNKQTDQKFKLVFNGVVHHMRLEESGRKLVLESPDRSVPSIASWRAPL